MYFSNFPKIVYNDVSIVDLSIRYKINDVVKNNVQTYETYRLKENEKPEDVAFRLYGDATLHWILLLMNDVTDPLDGWYRNDTELDRYVTAKYIDPSDVHHYMDSEGYVISEYVDASTVILTNRGYEESINNSRREIKVLKAKYIYQLLNEFETSLSNNA